MSALTVANIAARLLAFPAIASADAANVPGLLTWIVDAIMDAQGQIGEQGSGIAEEPIGGILKGPQTLNVTVSASAPTTLTLSASGVVPNDLCSIRIAGMSCDGTLKAVNGTNAQLAPGYDGISAGSTTVAATVFHDAWKISDGSNVEQLGRRVRVKGIPLVRVGSRMQAEAEVGRDPATYSQGGRRLTTLNADIPRVWWLEHYGAASFICVYPMPGTMMPIEERVNLGVTAVNEGNVLASTETFGFPDDFARNVFRPLAIQSFRNSPFMANVTIGDEIERQVARAREILEGVRPKPPGPRPWNMRPRGRYGFRDY